jgi:glycolate oxidase iron-sulfur subunit
MLERLNTDLGERSLYDAVSQCSRCGYCEQACPTYVHTGLESFSARGRNQLVRLLQEDKVKDPAALEAALSSCLLCGACTTVCPAKVPTADIVLEGRRHLRGTGHWLARRIHNLIMFRPQLFAGLLKAGYTLKRWGVAALVARSGLLHLLGLKGLAEATLHVDEAPSRLLFEELAEDSTLDPKEAASAAWAYFAPCGPNYVLPRVGLATLKVLKSTLGAGIRLENECCGLLSFNYGDVEQAREAAQVIIRRLEKSGLPASAPLVLDCSSCAAHLKAYPQMFLDDPRWKERAEAFAARVKDVAELIPADAAPAGVVEGTFHDACRAVNGQGIKEEPRGPMRRLCGEGYREMQRADVCCGGAGAFAFTHAELSEEMLQAKTGDIAASGAKVVAATSTSCLLQLARGLKKYYPECRVAHLSELVAERVKKSG